MYGVIVHHVECVRVNVEVGVHVLYCMQKQKCIAVIDFRVGAMITYSYHVSILRTATTSTTFLITGDCFQKMVSHRSIVCIFSLLPSPEQIFFRS